MSEARARADELLARIAEATREVAALEASAEEALARIREKHRPDIEKARAVLVDQEKELKDLARKRRVELFDNRDRVNLEHGSLIWGVSRRVTRARKVTVEALKKLGQVGLAAIRVIEEVDWDVIEGWPDERLVEIGTARKRRETVSYELKEAE